MSRFDHTLPAAYFDALYADNADPWRFAASPYEQAKYAATLAALPAPHYAAALEIGCSIGVLTRHLAGRCTSLLALDVAQGALDQARDRCRDLAHVQFARRQVPAEWPEGTFDLIVLSEVVYYLDDADVARLVGRVREAIEPAGDIVLVHWLGETHYPLTGDEAAERFIAASAGFAKVRSQTRADQYRLDVLRATRVRSDEGP